MNWHLAADIDLIGFICQETNVDEKFVKERWGEEKIRPETTALCLAARVQAKAGKNSCQTTSYREQLIVTAALLKTLLNLLVAFRLPSSERKKVFIDRAFSTVF